MYIISHSLASSHPRLEIRGLQCTYKSRSFPSPSKEFASRRVRPLCLWGQWSHSRPAANTVQQVPSPLLMQALNKTKTHYTSAQPRRCAACLALRWNTSKQQGFIWLHEGTWQLLSSQPGRCKDSAIQHEEANFRDVHSIFVIIIQAAVPCL